MEINTSSMNEDKLLLNFNEILGFSFLSDKELFSLFLLGAPLSYEKVEIAFPIIKLIPDAVRGMEKMDSVAIKKNISFTERGEILFKLLDSVNDALGEVLFFNCIIELKGSILFFDIQLCNNEGEKIEEKSFGFNVRVNNSNIDPNFIREYANNATKTFVCIFKEWGIYYSPCLFDLPNFLALSIEKQ